MEGLVQAEIARITRLVDDLLLLAKAEQTEFLRVEAIELPEYVSGLWDGMSLLATRRFELGEVPAGVLRADPDRVAQALRNLIGNAIEHTSGRGRSGAPARGCSQAGWIRFAVEDDGPGIARRSARAGVRSLPPHRRRARSGLRGDGFGACDRAGNRRGSRGARYSHDRRAGRRPHRD